MFKRLVFWSASPETHNNFGDALNKPLLKYLAGKPIVHCGSAIALRSPLHTILVGMGSILERAKFIERPLGHRVVVWGTGSKGKLESVRHLKYARICSVRGPMSREKLVKGGISVPEIYGDPAMLLPRYWEPGKEKRPKTIVIPHYKEHDIAVNIFRKKNVPDIELLNIRAPMEEIIKKISTAEAVLSSSLHGLIVADAFGTPSAWVGFGGEVGGGRFKFDDHYLAVWGRTRKQVKLDTTTRSLLAAQNHIEAPPQFDDKELFSSFPFELFK